MICIAIYVTQRIFFIPYFLVQKKMVYHVVTLMFVLTFAFSRHLFYLHLFHSTIELNFNLTYVDL